jgi:hypothetical protein
MVKLVKVWASVLSLTLFSRCVTVKNKEITFSGAYSLKTNIIRTDGYYYKEDPAYNLVTIFVFFENGYLFQGSYDSHEKVQELVYGASLKDRKYSWGAYKIDSDTIKVQFFSPARGNELKAVWDVLEMHGNIRDAEHLSFYRSWLQGKVRQFQSNYQFHPMDKRLDGTNWLMEEK